MISFTWGFGSRGYYAKPISANKKCNSSNSLSKRDHERLTNRNNIQPSDGPLPYR